MPRNTLFDKERTRAVGRVPLQRNKSQQKNKSLREPIKSIHVNIITSFCQKQKKKLFVYIPSGKGIRVAIVANLGIIA